MESELQEHIEKAIRQLPPQCQKIFIMNRFNDKSITQIAEELRKAEKRERAAVDADVQLIEKELANHRLEMEVRKQELLRQQKVELNGKGADTAAIDTYKAKNATMAAELEYIAKKQSLVRSYEKDKQE